MMTIRPSSPSSPVRKRAKSGSEEVFFAVMFSSDIYIYTVDVDMKEKEKDQVVVLRRPWIELGHDLPDLIAFVVVDSTLYMFGGMSAWGWEVKSYSLDLSLYSPFKFPEPKFSKDDEANRIPDMTSEKAIPAAACINGLICVFSLGQSPGTSNNFEMYDPRTQTWSSVPDLPVVSVDAYMVKFYCVENSFLYISTEKGSYCIDFSQPIGQREWKPYNIPTEPICPSFQSQQYLKDGDLICSSHFQFCDLAAAEPSWETVCGPPTGVVKPPYLLPFEKDLLVQIMFKGVDIDKLGYPPFKPGYFFCSERSIVRLANKDKERMRACIVETGWNETMPEISYHPLLRVTELKFDGLKPTVLNSCLFVCHGAARSPLHHILGVWKTN